jgi:hypothetical protein
MHQIQLMYLLVFVLCGVGSVQAEPRESKYFGDTAPRKSEFFYDTSPVAPDPSKIKPRYAFDITAHSNCVLENGKNARTTAASVQISSACRHKATPKKCRDVSAMPPDYNSKSPQEICVEGCKSEGMLSRKYGDCSLD